MFQPFILLLIVIHLAKTDDEAEPCECDPPEITTTPVPCGPYGFRCTCPTTYEICATYDSEGQIDSPALSRECFKGLACDEDNPAFCTPIDEEMAAFNASQNRLLSKRQLDNDELEITTTNRSPFDDDEEGYTTEYNPPYDCQGYGYYPDTANRTLFWYCDANPTGKGYVIRHMNCGKKRLFDPIRHECVLIGTTRFIRSNTSKRELLKVCRINNGKSQRFRMERSNCDYYYLCYNNNRDVIKMRCPDEYKFDDRFARCMPEHLVNCRDDDIVD